MKRIEITGPSGVGKTTLFLELSKIPQDKRPFRTIREAYVDVALRENIPVSQLKAYLYQKILKSGFFKHKKYGLSRSLLKEIEDRQSTVRECYQNFSISFNIIYQQYKEEMDPYHVLKRLDNFLAKAVELDLLQKKVPRGELILIDEGVLHYHFGITPYGFEMFSDQDLSRDTVLNPCGIISCELSVDKIFNRAMKRKKSGVKTYSQGHLEGERLRERIRITVNSNKSKIESFKKRNIPVLHINTDEPPHKNINEIIRFADRLK